MEHKAVQFLRFLTDVRSKNCSFGHVKRYLSLTSLADCEQTPDRKHHHGTSIPDRRHCILVPVFLYLGQPIQRNIRVTLLACGKVHRR